MSGQSQTSATATIIAVAAGALATVVGVWALLSRPLPTMALTLLLLVVAAIWLTRRRLLALSLAGLLRGMALALPLAAIIGPAAALPRAPQLFAYRVLLAGVAITAVAVALQRRALPRLRPRAAVLLIGVWFGWQSLTMVWAPDAHAGWRYLAILAADLVLLAAVGATRRRDLGILMKLLAVGYGLAVAVGTVESTLGRHLSSSVAAHGGKAHIATGFFYNPNDLAAFIGIAWPFLIVAFVGARWRGRLLVVAGAGAGVYCLLHTGSRSGLLTIGLATVVVGAWLLARGGVRRRGLLVVAGVLMLGGVVYLALNQSNVAILRQFQVAPIAQGAKAGTDSGGTRVALTEAGVRVAAHYGFLGVGPGNAEYLVAQRPEVTVDFANLHDWWLEVFVDGGLIGFVAFIGLYFVLLSGAARAALRSPDAYVASLSAALAGALVGFVVGALGPSTSAPYAPLWILLGLGLALLRAADDAAAASPGPAPHAAAPEAAQ